MKLKRSMALLLSMVCICGSLTAGCGEEKGSEQKKDSEQKEDSSTERNEQSEAEGADETVNIVWHRTAWHTNTDEKLVEDAINEYIEPLIGVTVTVLNDQENTQLDLALAAGDDIDLWWDATWNTANGFITNNSAYDLTEVIQDYPELYASMPEYVWEASKVNGKTYYVPVYKECGEGYSLIIPKEVVDKYGWDMSAVKELADIEPMLKDMYEDGVEYPLALHTTGARVWLRDDFAYLGDTIYAAVEREGDTSKVVNVIESQEYAEVVSLMRSWNEKGYINSEEASNEVPEQLIKELWENGNAGFYPYTTVPTTEANALNSFGKEFEVVQVSNSYMDTGSTGGSLYMVNAKTEKIDAVMKFLQLLFTDEKLANLACYGIEGTHYTVNENGRVVLNADSGFTYPGVWITTNVMTPSLTEAEPENKKDLYTSFNENVKQSVTFGFSFDKVNVEAEMTALTAVTAEYASLLERGFYDPETYIAKYQEALKQAGIDKVIEEMQTQWDAFQASK